MWYRIEQLKLDSCRHGADVDRILPAVLAERLGIPVSGIPELTILSRSIDARRGVPSLLYKLLFQGPERLSPPPDIALRPVSEEERRSLQACDPDFPDPAPALRNPVVVGTGPCGIFAALALARQGCRPVVIDRGFPVEKRRRDHLDFLATRRLDPESNLLIGEGGAGAFSDGKLFTGTRSGFSSFVLKTFAEAGAPKEILYLKHPHIGSDFLRKVAAALRRRIEADGGTFLFGAEVADVLVENDRCTGVLTAAGERIPAPAVLLAAGLGARTLGRALGARGLERRLKGFQIGSRIEHPQALVDRRQYHCRRRPASLGPAEYRLLSRGQAGGLPVCSFCMCPGGEVVMASAWEGRLVSNGMSDHARAGEFANSALIVTLPPERFASPEEAYAFLGGLEEKAFALGGADYTFPAQDAAAFLRRETGLRNARTAAETGVTPARLDRLLPPELRQGLDDALAFFDRQCPGFVENGKLLGIETCISSPVRFLRREPTLESSCPRLWIGGEQAGCAGGIMSAAIDGLRLATAILASRP